MNVSPSGPPPRPFPLRLALPMTALALAVAVHCTAEPPPGAPVTETGAAVATLTVAEPRPDLPRYDRDDWRHWTDEDGDCRNTRQEVLIAESTAAVTYTDATQCRVLAGRWTDPFTGNVFTDPADVDIDHLVPLYNAHHSGGWAWSAARKRAFANHLGYADHLMAVTDEVNQRKGARGPEAWRPPRTAYWCAYAWAWSQVKREWGLTVTPAEAAALRDMLAGCPGRVTVETVGAPPPPPPVDGWDGGVAPGEGGTYASCVEASDAGEPRLQGDIGSGRGYPAHRVPSARDGDGDGVVCEV